MAAPLVPSAAALGLSAARNESDERVGRDAAAVAAVASKRDAREIRRLFFAGLISSLLLLMALAIRDFIAGTVEDMFPQGGVKNRAMVLIVVMGFAFFVVLIIYEAELDA